MISQEKFTGFAIALAWPATYCKQAGSWYDPLMVWMGFSRNNYYKVGHSALVLVDPDSNQCHYFDFGRYHAPFNHGRVRSAETDHDLEIQTRPIISEDGSAIENTGEILNELQTNRSCHGDGNLYASWCRINFKAALDKAKQLQDISPIPYGPFHRSNSNCSRFSPAVIRAGRPAWKYRFRMKYFFVLTPSPMNIVNSLPGKTEVAAEFRSDVFYPHEKPGKDALKSTLKAPERNDSIPENAQWLSGEGAGSWFVFESLDSRLELNGNSLLEVKGNSRPVLNSNSRLEVTRYSPAGIIECRGIFQIKDNENIMPGKSWKITYPSNCRVVTFNTGSSELKFERVNE